MNHQIDFSLATSEQIEGALCTRLAELRLSRNITQKDLAREAGVSENTIRRLEKGQKTSLDTFIRVLAALGLQGNLKLLLPDPSINPLERAKQQPGRRRRARAAAKPPSLKATLWKDKQEDNDE
jgi:putative transcriptional regulator